MSVEETPKTVMVIAGPEWGPVREAVSRWFAANAPHAATPFQILRIDEGDASPTIRVANWLVRSFSAKDQSAVVVTPGDPVRRPHPSIGVTELLLDPDPFQVEQLYALGIWTRFVERRERLKMRVSPSLPADIVANAESFAPSLAVMVGEWIGQRMVIASSDLVAAEVVGRAIRAVAQPAGDIGLSPWQSPIVQAATERGYGVHKAGDINLEVRICLPIAPGAKRDLEAMLEHVSRLIDSGLHLR
jgi:hypothetical protein